MRTLRLAIVILVAFVANASADRNVDWSQYMEKPGDKPLVSTTPDVIRKAQTTPTPTRVAKAKKSKKPGKARKVKARSKSKSRRK